MMGDIADMMLDGQLCEGCGEVLGGEGDGFPVLCAGCAEDRRKAGHEIRDTGLGYYQDVTPIDTPPSKAKVECPHCGKRVKEVGLDQHIRDKHDAWELSL